MRGWFHLVSATNAETNPPTCRGFAKKRLMGFEPTTFCMAIRPTSDSSPCRKRRLYRRFSNDGRQRRRR